MNNTPLVSSCNEDKNISDNTETIDNPFELLLEALSKSMASYDIVKECPNKRTFYEQQ